MASAVRSPPASPRPADNAPKTPPPTPASPRDEEMAVRQQQRPAVAAPADRPFEARAFAHARDYFEGRVVARPAEPKVVVDKKT